MKTTKRVIVLPQRYVLMNMSENPQWHFHKDHCNIYKMLKQTLWLFRIEHRFFTANHSHVKVFWWQLFISKTQIFRGQSITGKNTRQLRFLAGITFVVSNF